MSGGMHGFDEVGWIAGRESKCLIPRTRRKVLGHTSLDSRGKRQHRKHLHGLCKTPRCRIADVMVVGRSGGLMLACRHSARYRRAVEAGRGSQSRASSPPPPDGSYMVWVIEYIVPDRVGNGSGKLIALPSTLST